MAYEYSKEMDDALRFNRPTLRTTRAFVGSIGLGALSISLDSAYKVASGLRDYSREHHLRRRLVGGVKSLGEQALSALGPISKAEDGIFLADSSFAGGYIVGGTDFSGPEPAHPQALPPTQKQDIGETV